MPANNMFMYYLKQEQECFIRYLTQPAHEVFSECFHNSQNENDMNYNNSDRMNFSVFVLRRGLCWFSLNCANLKVFEMNSK